MVGLALLHETDTATYLALHLRVHMTLKREEAMKNLEAMLELRRSNGVWAEHFQASG